MEHLRHDCLLSKGLELSKGLQPTLNEALQTMPMGAGDQSYPEMELAHNVGSFVFIRRSLRYACQVCLI